MGKAQGDPSPSARRQETDASAPLPVQCGGRLRADGSLTEGNSLLAGDLCDLGREEVVLHCAKELRGGKIR